MPKRKLLHSCHLDGPADAEDFMTDEGVNPEGDDEPEWLDNETEFDTERLGDEHDQEGETIFQDE